MNATARKLRISYARVLIEIDVTQARKESVTIKDAKGNIICQEIAL